MNGASEPEDVSILTKYKRLQKLKLTALALLAFSLAAYISAPLLFPPGLAIWIRSFFGASVVGGLADWFAVVALFRKPLGIPLPHTAIIPKSKNKIADNISFFIRDEFLKKEQILKKVIDIDPAQKLADALSSDKIQSEITNYTDKLITKSIAFIDDDFKEYFNEFIMATLLKWNASKTTGDMIYFLTKEEKHAQLLEIIIEKIVNYVSLPEVKDKLKNNIRIFYKSEYPLLSRLIGTVYSPEYISDTTANKVADQIISLLLEVSSNKDHPLRIEYNNRINAFMIRLRGDPELEKYIFDLKEKFLKNRPVQDYASSIWSSIVAWIRADLSEKSTSSILRQVSIRLHKLGARIKEDELLRKDINENVYPMVERALTQIRTVVTEHVSKTVKAWDEKNLVETLENNIGADLQFIRFNGMMIGGLAGLLVHALNVLPML